jgi:4-hydroxyacetophenone monooxygenase
MPTWRADEVAPGRPFRVVIVGAGMSGVALAHRLAQAGVDHVVLEKNDDVGGTWFENRYPGCRVDVPNHLYSYSFAQRDDWPQRFSTQDVLLDYFRGCAKELGVADRTRFGTEVLSATYREDDDEWEVTTRDRDGHVDTLRANAVVSAVGQLNRPRFPDIDGAEQFGGLAFHSARWPADADLRGRRVAVIGTAASAIQLIPAVAREAAELHVYQRTPNWFMPTPDYTRDVSDGMHWLLRHVPHYAAWYRLSLFWRLAEGALPFARVDPDRSADAGPVSASNAELASLLTMYLESQFADAPELLAAVVPDYPPLSKRILLDDGTWAATLTQDHVHLVTDGIERITPSGIVAGGVARDVDVIVYATGFEASSFLVPMKVTGVGGADLHERWGDDARAYLGITVPGFPNLFCMYGPNTNLVANGSIIFFSECVAQFILASVRLLLERGAKALDVRPDVHDAYNATVDEGNAAMAWGVASVNSWYRSRSGRISQNWPFSLVDFWQRTQGPDPDDYVFRGEIGPR